MCFLPLFAEIRFDSLTDDEVEMRLLAAEDVQSIHDLYPAADVESIEVFEKLINQLPGCGIFSLKTGELVAWMVQSYYGKRSVVQRPAIACTINLVLLSRLGWLASQFDGWWGQS